jgi:putative inorganic carbon (hco3(-)) transporter
VISALTRRPTQARDVGSRVTRIAEIGGWGALAFVVAFAVALPEEPLWVVLGAAAGVAIVAIVLRPMLGLPLLLVAVPFGTLARVSGDSTSDTTVSLGAVEAVAAMFAIAWLGQGVRQHRVNLRGGALVGALGTMAALAVFSVTYADDRSSALKEALKWLEVVVVLLAVVDLVRDARSARWVIAAALLAGGAEAAYGAYQFATGSGPAFFEVDGVLRAYGNFDQPNPFAGYLAMLLPLAVLMAACSANPLGFRLFALASGLAMLGGIGLSQSRGAWLGVAITAGVLLVMWSTATRRLLAPALGIGVAGTALAVSGLLPPALLDRVGQLIAYFGVFDVRTVELTSENFSVVERMAHWQAGWYMFLAHPWLGVGAGNYAEAYPNYYVATWLDPLGHAHNYYLNMLAELGVVGGLTLLLVLGQIFRHIGGALLYTHQPGLWRAVLGSAVGAMVVFCVHNLFDDLFVHGVNVQIAILLGLALISVDRLRTRSATD